MKSIQTGWPFRLARSIVPPPTCGMVRAGAGSPTWNCDAGPLADDTADAATDGAADGELALGATDGNGVGGAVESIAIGGGVDSAGSGANARIPPRTSPPTTTPSTR